MAPTRRNPDLMPKSQTEMVERVARALAEARGGEITGPSRHRASDEFGWDGNGNYRRNYVEAHWREHVHAAGFAIEAMRTPTPAMTTAGENTSVSHSWGSDGEFVTADSAADLWSAMIDVALAETKPAATP